jgi:hypothetical protein
VLFCASCKLTIKDDGGSGGDTDEIDNTDDGSGEVIGRPDIPLTGTVIDNFLTFRFSGPGASGKAQSVSRSVIGPSDEDISNGTLCNVYQLIAIDDDDTNKTIWDFDEASAKDANNQYELRMQVAKKHTYHILILGGYKGTESNNDYVLLIAGYAKAEINNTASSISVPLYTMTPDFEFSGTRTGYTDLHTEPIKGQTLELDKDYSWTAHISMSGIYGDDLTPLKMAEVNIRAPAGTNPPEVNSDTTISFNDGSAAQYTGTHAQSNALTPTSGRDMQLTLSGLDAWERGPLFFDLSYSPFSYKPDTFSDNYVAAGKYVYCKGDPSKAITATPVWHIRNGLDNSGLRVELIDTNYIGGLYEVKGDTEYTIENWTDEVIKNALLTLNTQGGINDPISGVQTALDGRSFLIKMRGSDPSTLGQQTIGSGTLANITGSSAKPVNIGLLGMTAMQNISAIAPAAAGPLVSISGKVNFTLQNNITISGLSAPTMGALFSVAAGASLSVEGNSVLSGNTNAQGAGGAVDVAGSFTLAGTASIQGNKATKGGGVAVESGGVFTLNGGSISANTASTTGGGSGVYITGGTFNLLNGTVYGPSAPDNLGNTGDSVSCDSGTAQWAKNPAAYTGYRSSDYIQWIKVDVPANSTTPIITTSPATTADTLTTNQPDSDDITINIDI